MATLPAFSGGATRPAGSDWYPPVPGTRVSWTAVTPVVDAATQAVKDGVTAYVIGNIDHLRKHGDHTPWSAGKVRGRVYATDVMIESAEPARTRLLAYLKSDTDTRWIDFLNFGGLQYDYAGRVLAPSGDYHLHLSVRAGYENAKGTSAAELVHYVITGQRFSKPAPAPVVTQPATTQEDDDDMKLVKVKGLDPVYKTDGFVRVHVTPAEYKALVAAGFKLTELPAGTDLNAFGPVLDSATAAKA